MVFSFNATTRSVLEQVVREPEFKALAQLPLLAPMELAVGVGAFVLFGLSTGLYMTGEIPLVLMWCLNSVAIYASFTPLHDATHRSVSRHRGVNDLIGTVCCLLLLPGITTRIYRYLHLEHHRFAGDAARDPDELFVSASPLMLPFILAGLDVHWSRWYINHWHTRPAGERREFVACLAFYLSLHVLMLLSPYALEFFLCFMLPQRVGLFLVAWFFAHIQHPQGVEWERAPFQATVLVKTNFLGRCLMLGQSYHCLHHLAPSIPFYRYERAWRFGADLFEQQNVPTRTLWRESQDLTVMGSSPAMATTTLKAKVVSVKTVANSIREFELTPVEGECWPRFEAGAHIDVKLQGGLTRQYSLCNSPADAQRYCIAVKRETDGRGGSNWLHTQVLEGDTLAISPPRNNFPLRSGVEHSVLVGCGIGVTPLLSMAHELFMRKQSFVLHVFANQLSDLAFHDQLAGLPFAECLQIHVGTMTHSARVDQASALAAYQPGSGLYLCGPLLFMEGVIAAAKANSWPVENIWSESFSASQAEIENRPFEVQLASTGEVLQVDESEHLIDVLHAHGYAVACSCTQGICGSCITPVLEGVPEHRDAIMTESQRDANRSMTVCVSRARSQRLVLDL